MSDSEATGVVTAPPGAQRSGHLVLVGLPGAGKTTVGKMVARQLGRAFIDFDQELQKRESKSVSAIFAERGEAGFRLLEVALTEEFAKKVAMVWAPGGGWITNPGVVALVRPPGRIIHLRVSPKAALARLGSSRASRPLLIEGHPEAILDRLWVGRSGLYALADAEVDTELVDLQRVAEQVVTLARDFDAKPD